MMLRLDQIREAMEGAIPAVIATCSAEGEPNVSFLSQVHYVDERHVALSYQFFNKTRRNVLANPVAHLTLVHPLTARLYRLRLRYLRTENEGALFERMRAHLEGIASHTGMAGVFRLLGSDIYEVTELEAQPGQTLAPPAPKGNALPALRRASEALAACTDAGHLVETALDLLQREFGIEHAMLLAHDEAGQRLYTLGSRGYRASGIGSEIAIGDGVIGMCAQARTPIRISWLTQAYRYHQTIRDISLRDGAGQLLSTEIPYPGLPHPHSQLGLPLLHGGRLYGVLFVESDQDLRFSYDDEDLLASLAAQVAGAMRLWQDAPDTGEAGDEGKGAAGSAPGPLAAPASARGADEPADLQHTQALRVRCFEGTNSVFFGDHYVIKGVAGAILWRLLQEFQSTGRCEFSNREIRLDPAIRLPDVVDNLEARLILLRRRLSEQAMGVTIEKSGRGRLRLRIERALEMQWIQADPGMQRKA